jgi:hypothetical protein
LVWDREVGGSNPLAPTIKVCLQKPPDRWLLSLLITRNAKNLLLTSLRPTFFQKKAEKVRFLADFIESLWYTLLAVFQFC